VNAPTCEAERFREIATGESTAGDATISDILLPPLKILVAEDEGLIALNLELMLLHFGCEIVGPIWEVDDILGAARKHRPDGALLDVNLRGRKVFDVLPEMIGLGIPCVLSSGYDDPTLFPAAFRDMPRIAKPFDEKALRRACALFVAGTDASRAGEAREHHAVPFPRLRRVLSPAQQISQDDERHGRAVAGRRRR
jgi:DNA-binding LytR/AlgR family response regulator